MPKCDLCKDTGTVTIGGIDPVAGHPVHTPIPCPKCTVARPKIVCLCGSTKFKAEFLKAQFDFSLKGIIVLTTAGFSHADNIELTDDQKAILDALHMRKIDMADFVFVINVGQYIGESTAREIAHAEAQRKPVNYLEPVKPLS